MMMRRLAIVLIIVAAQAAAQAPPSFREGVLAFEKKDWKAAEKFMREAVAGNPNESAGTVSIAGSWFETYVPHYFLARALAKQGKCAEALKEFAESERQGVTPAIPDFARHLDNRGGCKPSVKPDKPAKVIDEFNVPMDDVPITPKKTTPKVDQPKIDTPKIETPNVNPLPPIDPKKAQQRVETRARLATAIASYLRGEYEMTTRLLSAASFDDRVAAAEAALFRAAARHALYRIGGESDAALRSAIEADLRIYRQLRPNGRPDPRLFPPRFIALVR